MADAQRNSLLNQIESAQNALDRESKSGFGPRSKAAADHLDRLNSQLRQLDATRRDNDPRQRAIKLGINVGAPVVGMTGGALLAKGIEKRHAATMGVRAAQAKALGAEARKLLKRVPSSGAASPLIKSKLGAIAATASKLNLSRIKGPLGLTTAGLLLAEGAFSRFVLANQVQSEQGKEALRAVGTASAFAATSLIGKRLVANATPKVLPAARDLAAISTAGRLAGVGKLAGGASRLLIAGASKVALPLAVAAAAYSAYQGYRRDGVRGAAVGAADSFTLGLFSSAVKAAGYGSYIGARPSQTASARLSLSRSAAARSARAQRTSATLSGARASIRSDGMTAAYSAVRRVGNKSVRVSVRSYRTPTRGRA